MRDKAFSIDKNPKYDEYQRRIASLVYVLIKKTSGTGSKNENMLDQQLGKELHKPTIKKFKKSKITFYR